MSSLCFWKSSLLNFLSIPLLSLHSSILKNCSKYTEYLKQYHCVTLCLKSSRIPLNSNVSQWKTLLSPEAKRNKGLVKPFSKSHTVLRVIRLIDSCKTVVSYLSLYTFIWQIYFLNTLSRKIIRLHI